MKTKSITETRAGLKLIVLSILFCLNLKAQTIITTSIVLKAGDLLPLDKSKPGYYEDKPNGRVTQAGYKKDGQYHGEQREYEDSKEGNCISVSIWKNGQADGFRLEYDWGYDEKGFGATKPRGGCLYMVRNYREGEKHGPTQAYKCNGKLDGPPKMYENGNWVDQ